MKIKILHLYFDLMNLYGEYANVSALCRHLEDSGVEIELDKVSVGDDFNLLNYDFIYCGAGTERNLSIALADFVNHKDELSEYAQNNKPALFTGNSFEMLGESVFNRDGEKLDGMSLANFIAYQGGKGFKYFIEANPDDKILAENDNRITGDAIFTADFIDKPIVGFINKCGFIKGDFTPLLTVKYGIGNNKNDKTDGVRVNNILGTHLTGPLLVKNPPMLSYLISVITNGEDIEEKEYKSELLGYEVTVRELMKRFTAE